MVLIDIDRSRENAINCGIRAMDFATQDLVYREYIKNILRGIITDTNIELLDQIECINPWISVKDRLPEDRTLVWIYIVYEDSSYDDVKDRVSIGIFYNNEAWSDLLDFPFADDYTVLYWMPLQFPEKPSQKV